MPAHLAVDYMLSSAALITAARRLCGFGNCCPAYRFVSREIEM